MEVKVGDNLIYHFPEAAIAQKKNFVGTVDIISDNYISLINKNNIKLKVSFKNFKYIEQYDGKIRNLSIESENYIG